MPKRFPGEMKWTRNLIGGRKKETRRPSPDCWGATFAIFTGNVTYLGAGDFCLAYLVNDTCASSPWNEEGSACVEREKKLLPRLATSSLAAYSVTVVLRPRP